MGGFGANFLIVSLSIRYLAQTDRSIPEVFNIGK